MSRYNYWSENANRQPEPAPIKLPVQEPCKGCNKKQPTMDPYLYFNTLISLLIMVLSFAGIFIFGYVCGKNKVLTHHMHEMNQIKN